MNKKRAVAYILLVFGILVTLSGIVLTIYSFHHEVLDEKYIIKEITNYKPEEEKIKTGEIKVIREINYQKDGEYELIYKMRYNREDIDILLSNKSNFTITEEFEDYYELNKNKIIINEELIKLYSPKTVTSDYEIDYVNNIFEISFPVQKIADFKTIKVNVKLKSRKVNEKLYISKESYYSFIPNISNDYYTKKTNQSYIIEGNGYILLENKK